MAKKEYINKKSLKTVSIKPEEKGEAKGELLVSDLELERLINEDFDKYSDTFKALSGQWQP